MRSLVRRRLSAEDGFTLVELVVTVAILGIIVVALAGVVLAFLRNTVDTEARLTESHDVQFAAAYWQRDVASVGVRSNAYDTSTHSFALEPSVDVGPCGLPDGATAVVTLAWSEYTSMASDGEPTKVRVTYAARSAGASYELLRIRCGSQPSTVQVADSLAAVPTATCHRADGATIACTGAAGEVPEVVKLLLTVQDSSSRNPAPYVATLSGERRQT
jgi:prepilin-type N-terminal cleavage/methylation domain-containing protein